MFAPRTFISALALAAAATAFPTSVDPSSVVPASAAVPTPAAPAPTNLKPHSFEVYDPPITKPQAGDVWTSGSNQTVKWDVSRIGDDGHNTTARLLLGHKDPGSLTEYLDIRNPLATDFPVDAGEVTFLVPEVISADNYIVVLVGSISDSGNASPEFTIQNPKESALPSFPTPSAPSDIPSPSSASLTSVPASTDVPSSVPVDAASSVPAFPTLL